MVHAYSAYDIALLMAFLPNLYFFVNTDVTLRKARF